jgi:hypothetical protein
LILTLAAGLIALAWTGFALKFPDSLVAHPPGSYEAILACLAVLVWHLCPVIFDPDVYPLNRAVWDGRVWRQWLEEEHPLDPALAGGEPEAAAPKAPAHTGKDGGTKRAQL